MENDKKNWMDLHCSLRDDLQKEIHLTRELLANMRQEEVSLMLRDGGGLNLILQQRAQMLEKLSSLRVHRQETTQKIEKIVSIESKSPTLDQILPPNEEITSEILSLSDQLTALNERMNRQQSQNQRLVEHPDHHHYPQPLEQSQQARPKRKASIATYQTKK